MGSEGPASRRIVITGVGAVSAFGVGVEPMWSALREGACGIGPIRAFDASTWPTQLAGELPEGFSARDHVPKSHRKGVKVMARDIELAVAAALAAVQGAGWMTRAIDPDAPPTYPPERVACQIGAGLIAADVPELALAIASAGEGTHFSYEQWGTVGMQNLTPLWMLKYLPNMLACHVTILHDARGPSNTITCAEASGILSIGESMRVIERGDADAALAGGVESKVHPTWLVRLALLRRLAECSSGDDPTGAVRPYDEGAAGTVVGEGGGILVLEEASAARRRGATPLALLEGFGAGHEPMGLDRAPTGEGLAVAIRAALRDAGIGAGDIDFIVPQACGVPEVDRAEGAALRAVFGDRLASVPLVTIAPLMGDLGAGSAAMGVCVATQVLAHQELPARIHGGRPAKGLDAGKASARAQAVRRGLVCSGSMGGQCGALILGRGT